VSVTLQHPPHPVHAKCAGAAAVGHDSVFLRKSVPPNVTTTEVPCDPAITVFGVI